MAVNFNGTSLVASNANHNINFNGCTVCTVLQDGKFVFDRQCAGNLNMCYGRNQVSSAIMDSQNGNYATRTKPARYLCMPTLVTKDYQLLAVNDGWTAYNLWAKLSWAMGTNIRVDSGDWKHIYANGAVPLCYSVVGSAQAYFCAGFCVVSTNFGTLCQKLIPLDGVYQEWTNLWTCWKPFTANPTLCLCNPNMLAVMQTPVKGSGLIWGAFDGTYTATGCTCAHPLDVWVAYVPHQLVVCYSAGVSRTFNIANNGCCPGATAWINMCFD